MQEQDLSKRGVEDRLSALQARISPARPLSAGVRHHVNRPIKLLVALFVLIGCVMQGCAHKPPTNVHGLLQRTRYFSDPPFGGSYLLVIRSSGTYEEWIQQHMHTSMIERGHWSIGPDDLVILNPVVDEQSTRTNSRLLKFLFYKGFIAYVVVSGEDNVISESEAIKEMDNTPPGERPNFVMSEISRKEFKAGISSTTPFIYFPNMNQEGKKTK